MRTRLWWLTGACVLLALGLVVSSLRSQGSPIIVHFEDGHGIKPGDTLRYRGIDVGAVTAVQINSALDQVDVSILLLPGNEKIAVEGGQFWIERARVRLGQISGLDTVLGAKYVGVRPGAPDGPMQNEFQGVETPLNIARGDSLEIRIQFPAGEGLAVGDMVRHRGISVGEVTYVELAEALDSVEVGVRLVGAARAFAREGTQFWIERPRLDLTEIRGLETLIGGRYIAMESPPADAAPQSEFTGLAQPPPLPRRDGSLEIELDASSRLGLVRGAPVTYRGLEVGRVSNVGLSRDGATVKVNAVIDAEYAELVRANSKWWGIGGVKVDANLRGVHIAIDSLSAWIRGGIAFATPQAPGERVVTGHRFVLEEEPLPEWLEWQPRIAVGPSADYGRELPQPVRVVASWQSSWLGLYRRRTLECWSIVLDDGYLRVPVSFAEQAAAVEGDVMIEVAGQSFTFQAEEFSIARGIAAIALPDATKIDAWPRAKVAGTWDGESTLLVVNLELSEPMPLDATRLAVNPPTGITIAPGVPISEALLGSPVVDSRTAKVVGLLIQVDDTWNIGLLAPSN